MEKNRTIELKSAYDFIGLRNIYNICDEYLRQSAADKNLDGPEQFTPGQWTNRLKELNRIIFFGNAGLLRTGSAWIDRQKVVSIYFEIYRPLVYEYNQIIKLEDFSLFIGITRQCIYKWNDIEYLSNVQIEDRSSNDLYNTTDNSSKSKDDSNISIYRADAIRDNGMNASPAIVNLCQQIKVDNESCLADRMITDKSNPLRYIAILNTKHNWNEKAAAETHERQLTIQEMRAAIGLLSAGDGQTAGKSNNKKDNRQNNGKVLEK